MRLLLLLFVLGACGGGPLEPLPICSLCATDEDCASGTCRMYGDGYRKCSTSCAAGEAAPQCATMTEPGFCNGMGFCTCPFMAPPADARVGDGGYFDAPPPP